MIPQSRSLCEIILRAELLQSMNQAIAAFARRGALKEIEITEIHSYSSVIRMVRDLHTRSFQEVCCRFSRCGRISMFWALTFEKCTGRTQSPAANSVACMAAFFALHRGTLFAVWNQLYAVSLAPHACRRGVCSSNGLRGSISSRHVQWLSVEIVDSLRAVSTVHANMAGHVIVDTVPQTFSLI